MFLDFLKTFDLFGVFFTFRMANYELYTSKTGGYLSISCIIFCSFFIYNMIYEFFDESKNFDQEKFERFSEGSQLINIAKQNFESPGINFTKQKLDFGFIYQSYSNDSRNTSDFIVKAFLKTSDSFQDYGIKRKYKYTPIGTKQCNFTKNETKYGGPAFGKLNNFTCLNFTSNHVINGTSSKIFFSQIEVIIFTRSEEANGTNPPGEMFLTYPLFRYQDKSFKKLNKEISIISTSVLPNLKLEKNCYLKKINYIYKDNLFDYIREPIVDKNEFSEIVNIEIDAYSENTNLKKYGIDPIPNAYKEVAKFKFRVSDTEKIITNTRKSLISLLVKIISFFIDIILTLGIIGELLNLRKAKTEVIEKSFYIVEEEENQENLTYSNSINSSNNNNFFKNENEIKIEIEMKQKKLLDLKIQDINKRFSKDISNFDSINDNSNDSNNYPNNNSNIKKNIQEDFIYEENNNNNASNSEDMDPDIDYINKYRTDKEKIKSLISNDNKKDKGKYYEKNDKYIDNDNNTNNDIDNYITKSKKSIMKKRNKLTKSLGLRRILSNILRCRCNRIYLAQKIFEKAEETFDNHMYIKSYIDKMREIECLKKFIFNQEEEKLFTNGIKPILKRNDFNLDKKEDEKGEENLDLEINQLYSKYIESDNKNLRLIELIKESIELKKDDFIVKKLN